MKTDFYHSEITCRDPHQDLITGCIRGDHRSQLGIYKAYYKPMYNTSLRILKDSGEAELIMQESFLFAFENIETFRGTTSFIEWLRSIVVKRSNEALRENVDENGRGGEWERGRRR